MVKCPDLIGEKPAHCPSAALSSATGRGAVLALFRSTVHLCPQDPGSRVSCRPSVSPAGPSCSRRRLLPEPLMSCTYADPAPTDPWTAECAEAPATCAVPLASRVLDSASLPSRHRWAQYRSPQNPLTTGPSTQPFRENYSQQELMQTPQVKASDSPDPPQLLTNFVTIRVQTTPPLVQ